MSDAPILTDIADGIAVLTINRPKVLNALDIPTLLELEAAVARLEADKDVRVIIFTGAGERAFVAGGDIADLKSRGGLAHYNEFAEVIHRVFRKIETSDKPTIAAVQGFALGGGTELILATDIRILADNARLDHVRLVEDAADALLAARQAGGNCVRAAPVEVSRFSAPGSRRNDQRAPKP